MKIKDFIYFYPEAPRLCHIEQPLFERLSQSKDWIAEKKYNEQRLQLHWWKDRQEYWNRHGAKLKYQPTPEVAQAVQSFPCKGYCLFDAGLRHNKTVGVRNKIVIYDVYMLNHELLIGLQFRKRRALLENTITPNDVISLPTQYPIGFRNLFDHVTQDPEIEGLVMKNLNGMVELGRKAPAKSKWMYKVRIPSGRYKF
jgi:ATP-dependent DNA ligase